MSWFWGFQGEVGSYFYYYMTMSSPQHFFHSAFAPNTIETNIIQAVNYSLSCILCFCFMCNKRNKSILSIFMTSINNSLLMNRKCSSFPTCRISRKTCLASSWSYLTPERPARKKMKTDCEEHKDTESLQNHLYTHLLGTFAHQEEILKDSFHIKKHNLQWFDWRWGLTQELLLLKLNST